MIRGRLSYFVADIELLIGKIVNRYPESSGFITSASIELIIKYLEPMKPKEIETRMSRDMHS